MAGRPPINKWDDVEAIQAKIDNYFATETTHTFCGLALALGYCHRNTLIEVAKGDHPISLPIKVAMLRVEESYERLLKTKFCVGAIFALKNRGWTDKNVEEQDKSIERLERIAEIMMGIHARPPAVQ